MPGTRRKRATPPEEPENNNNHATEAAQQEQAGSVEQPAAAEETSAPASTPPSMPSAEEQVQGQEAQAPQAAESPQVQQAQQAQQTQQAQPAEPPRATEQPVETSRQEEVHTARASAFAPMALVPPVTASSPSANGDHQERQEGVPPSPVERVRRTFRRPPQTQEQQQTYPQPAPHAQHTQPSQYAQPPQPQQAPQQSFAAQAPLQPPTHEITLPLGNMLHLAYNPGYTGAEEARSHLLSQLARESKAGGRARCWNCGSIAVVYERWNTRSRTFGEIGIAFCEICGVWSVM